MNDPELPKAVPIGETPELELPQALPVPAAPESGLPRQVPDPAALLRPAAHGPLTGAAGLEAVARITQAVMRRASVKDVLAGIVAGVREELSSDAATLLLLENGVLRVEAASGVEQNDARDVPVPVGEGFAGAIAATRQPLALPEVTLDRVRSAYLPEAIRSLLGVPLIADDELVGVLHVGWRTPRVPSNEERAFLELLGAPASAAIVRSRLYDAERASRRAAEEATVRLAELSEAKSQFLSTMSHELRTPLNAIIGYASLLRDRVAGPLTALQREHVGRILTASDHLLTLINEVLTLSRLDAGKERIDPSVFDLAASAAAVTEMVVPIAARKGLRINVEADEPLPVRSDETKVRQILLNLLSNAIKFTESGEVSVHVATAQDARVEVRDTGRGVAPDDRERIFEPFFQVSQGTTRSEGGSGLGLTVSRRLARLLGGEIEVESEVGDGSTFTFRLPLA